MYDKTVRRRRVVLGLLVASSLILLTAYFGESAGGGLHSVQRGVLDVVSPIQEGASRALKPVRDLFGWAGDTFHAKGQLKDMRKDRDALRAQNIQLQAKLREPITVYRTGTVRGSDDGAIELQPSDRRYVVARIRTLCAEDESFQITGCDWK